MNQELIRLGRYRHDKGGTYEVMCVAVHSETLEKTVIYRDVLDASRVWARPLRMWNQYVNAEEPPFRFVDERPFLLRACAAGAFGERYGCIYEAGFIYLTGEADTSLIEGLEKQWPNRVFVACSQTWGNALKRHMTALTRFEMGVDMNALNEKRLSEYVQSIPAGYQIVPFDEQIFAKRPFHHGTNFASWDDFQQNGSGFVALCAGEPVASASSYLTRGSETELDVSTHKAHRRQHLALACAAAMLLDCREKGLIVHWDAQNVPSRRMAEKLGYHLAREYTAYCLIEPEAI